MIGAETYPDADPARVEAVLAQLVKDGNPALVLLESGLSHAGGTWLDRLRNEGGRIVVTELPPRRLPMTTPRRSMTWYVRYWDRRR